MEIRRRKPFLQSPLLRGRRVFWRELRPSRLSGNDGTGGGRLGSALALLVPFPEPLQLVAIPVITVDVGLLTRLVLLGLLEQSASQVVFIAAHHCLAVGLRYRHGPAAREPDIGVTDRFIVRDLLLYNKRKVKQKLNLPFQLIKSDNYSLKTLLTFDLLPLVIPLHIL